MNEQENYEFDVFENVVCTPPYGHYPPPHVLQLVILYPHYDYEAHLQLDVFDIVLRTPVYGQYPPQHVLQLFSEPVQ